MTKYGIKHKVTGKYFDVKLGDVFYYRDTPKSDSNEYWDFMTEAILVIISLGGEDFLEVFQQKF